MKKILYIQHASSFGGSAMSLLYTLQGLKKEFHKDYKIIIALAKWNQELSNFYTDYGFEVVKPKWIDTYEHSQAVSYNIFNPFGLFLEIKQQLNILKARRNTKILLESIKPDIVHLNSVVLLGSAIEINKMKIPLVWHVREHSTNGFMGLRRKRIIKSLIKFSNKIIFICNSDKISWGNPRNGIVIYNFIDFRKFDCTLKDNVNKNEFNVLFLGGMNKIKGTNIMINAFSDFVKKNNDKNIFLIFAGGVYQKPQYIIYKIASKILPFICLNTYSSSVEKLIIDLNIEKNIIRLPFIKNVEQLYQIADVLVFPSTKPHFSRPIIEANNSSAPKPETATLV